MAIVHDADYVPAQWETWSDEPYFRLIHHLHGVGEPEPFLCFRKASEEDLPLVADVIKHSYGDLSVTVPQLLGYRKTPVFDPELWILACDRQTGAIMGCGIADFDRELGEGILEWIQVLPAHRRRGVGRGIVNRLLSLLEGKAHFVTVSGKANDPCCPEALYRSCGFQGTDLWHILRKGEHL